MNGLSVIQDAFSVVSFKNIRQRLCFQNWVKGLCKHTWTNVRKIPPRDLGQDLFIGFTQLNQS